MSERPRPLVAGNWKMNGLKASLTVAEAVRDGLDAGLGDRIDVLVCPPATLVAATAAALKGSGVTVGGQDVHAEASGAYTGNVSAEMLADAGATYAIVGHSERRAYHHESDADIRAKALAARRAGLIAIICVGETREEREAGRTLEVVRGQLAGSLPDGATAADTVIAYEPVWAIGSGRTPTATEIAEVHASLREMLDKLVGEEAHKIRILYGGSVKPSNARELMAVENVDGALVGGASLVAEDFLGICRAYEG
jgi:triosephosphate isomerase